MLPQLIDPRPQYSDQTSRHTFKNDSAELPLDRPAYIPDPDEWAMRRSLYAEWRRGADEFRGMLLVARDFFEERQHPDAAVCRAVWNVVGNSAPSPRRWWKWSAEPDKSVCPNPKTPWPKTGPSFRANHNRRVWLCWPPGWVRLVSGFRMQGIGRGFRWIDVSVDCFTMTVTPHELGRSKPIELLLPGGFTDLFRPQTVTCPACVGGWIDTVFRHYEGAFPGRRKCSNCDGTGFVRNAT